MCSAADKFITFQDLSNVLYSNVTIIKADKDGVMLRFGDEYRYARVQFTNMSEQAQLLCGYDAKKLAQQREKQAAEYQLAKDRYQTAKANKQEIEINLLSILVAPIDSKDFPKSERATAGCKEITAELKGIKTAIGLGVAYNKYSDLLTDTAIKVQKLIDIQGDNLPLEFKSRSKECIAAYDSARDWWSKKIDSASASESIKAYYEYLLQNEWAEADIHLTICSGIAESSTNVNDLVFDKALSIVETEKAARIKGKEARLLNYYSLTLLSNEEVREKLREKLSSK